MANPSIDLQWPTPFEFFGEVLRTPFGPSVSCECRLYHTKGLVLTCFQEWANKCDAPAFGNPKRLRISDLVPPVFGFQSGFLWIDSGFSILWKFLVISWCSSFDHSNPHLTTNRVLTKTLFSHDTTQRIATLLLKIQNENDRLNNFFFCCLFDCWLSRPPVA